MSGRWSGTAGGAVVSVPTGARPHASLTPSPASPTRASHAAHAPASAALATADDALLDDAHFQVFGALLSASAAHTQAHAHVHTHAHTHRTSAHSSPHQRRVRFTDDDRAGDTVTPDDDSEASAVRVRVTAPPPHAQPPTAHAHAHARTRVNAADSDAGALTHSMLNVDGVHTPPPQPVAPPVSAGPWWKRPASPPLQQLRTQLRNAVRSPRIVSPGGVSSARRPSAGDDDALDDRALAELCALGEAEATVWSAERRMAQLQLEQRRQEQQLEDEMRRQRKQQLLLYPRVRLASPAAASSPLPSPLSVDGARSVARLMCASPNALRVLDVHMSAAEVAATSSGSATAAPAPASVPARAQARELTQMATSELRASANALLSLSAAIERAEAALHSGVDSTVGTAAAAWTP